MIAVRELLVDFEFQRCRVNFYELKSVVARLSENEKNPLGRRLVNYDLGGRVKSDTSRISMYLNARHINTYIFIYCFMYDHSTSQAKCFVCRLGVFCELWKNTSLHATQEKIYSLAV